MFIDQEEVRGAKWVYDMQKQKAKKKITMKKGPATSVPESYFVLTEMYGQQQNGSNDTATETSLNPEKTMNCAAVPQQSSTFQRSAVGETEEKS